MLIRPNLLKRGKNVKKQAIAFFNPIILRGVHYQNENQGDG